MGLKSSAALSMTGLVLFIASCAPHHCRRRPDQPLETPEAVKELEASAANSKDKTPDRVLVFKYDGSLQCNQGRPVAPEEMAKQLKGITIHSMEKKSDGLMHIQVCGAVTGRANVFEIPMKDWPAAEKLGFRQWKFE